MARIPLRSFCGVFGVDQLLHIDVDRIDPQTGHLLDL